MLETNSSTEKTDSQSRNCFVVELMDSKYQLISSHNDFKAFSITGSNPIRFIGLLKSVRHNGSSFILDIDDGSDETLEESTYCVKLIYNDGNSERLARMALSLILQNVEITVPELYKSQPFAVKDIYCSKLSFIQCDGLYVAKDGKYSIFLEDVHPYRIENAIEMAEQHEKEVRENKIVYNIFKNLLKLDQASSNHFNVINLKEYQNDRFKQFIADLRESTFKVAFRNPIFNSTRFLRAPEESQDDFNSQFVGGIPIHGMDIDNLESVTPSSDGIKRKLGLIPDTNDHRPHNSAAVSKEKRRKPSREQNSKQWEPSNLSSLNLGAKCSLQGIIVGIFPTVFKRVLDLGQCSLKLYLIPAAQQKEITLVPNVNCIEMVLSKLGDMEAVLGPLIKDSRSLQENLINQEVKVELERSKLNLKHALYTSYWKLQTLHFANDHPKTKILLTHMNKLIKTRTPTKIRETVSLSRQGKDSISNDPCIKFRDLKLNNNEVKYVTLIGLLVSCSFEHGSYVTMVSTDFTKNDINQKFLFDRYLIDYDNKLESNEGFRTMIYLNQFNKFDDQIIAAFGSPLRTLMMMGTENISHRGIICKMTLKMKIYNDKLNAIVRDMIPLTVSSIVSHTERAHLRSLYEAATSRIPNIAIARNFDFYKTCFPLTLKDGFKVTLNTSQEYEALESMLEEEEEEEEEVEPADTYNQQFIPHLNTDISIKQKMVDETNFTMLSTMEGVNTKLIYRIDSQILDVGYDKTHLEMVVTNDFIAGEYVDPSRVLRIHIIGKDNLSYFFNLTARETENIRSAIQTHLPTLESVVGEVILFKIVRGTIELSANVSLAIWCPVETTLEEIKTQLRITQDTNPDTIDVKIEE